MKFIVYLIVLLSTLKSAQASASMDCELFASEAALGMQYFADGRNLLSVVHLGPFLHLPSCQKNQQYYRIESAYILALWRLGELGAANDILFKTANPDKATLLALLFNDSKTLSKTETQRFLLWSNREEMNPSALTDIVPPAEAAELALLKSEIQSSHLSPGLAVAFSVVLPGAGQAYAGAWQSAALSFVLNGVLLASTIQLAKHQLGWPAALTGTMLSITYVGGIISAWQAATMRNQVTTVPYDERLFRDLYPDLPEYSHFRR